jgi:toxin CcdB
MAQFDLFRLSGGQVVVDLQTDLIGIDASRIVARSRPLYCIAWPYAFGRGR